MTVEELLAQLRSLDAKVWVEGDHLRINAPRGTLAPALQAELAARKADVIEFLRQTTLSQSASLTIRPVTGSGPIPLSFAQQRLWLFDQLWPGNVSYNLYDGVRLTGRLDVAALDKSLTEILRRHEALRTTFQSMDGQPVQIVAPPQPFQMNVVDLRVLPEADRLTQLKRLTVEEVQRPFDLAQGPLVRVLLLQVLEQDYAMIVTMHHIISDAWSLNVLWRELKALYEAFSTGQSSPLPELPIQYGDYACWQRGWLQGEVLEAQLAYWKQQLANVPTLELPTDHPRPAVQSFRGATQSLTLSQPLTEALKALSRQQNATLFMTLLAAFQTLLSCHTGQEDICVGMPIAGRNRAETENLIGFFLNTLALRADLTGNPSFRQLLDQVRSAALGAFAHQDLPFEKLVEELQPERDLSRTPLFQVMFNMLPASDPIQLRGLSVQTYMPVESEAKFDLSLYGSEPDGKIQFQLVYNADLFSTATIQQMVAHFQTLLEGIAIDPDRRLSDLPILTESERRQRSFKSNRVRPVSPFTEFQEDEIHQSIASCFEKQVKLNPKNMALRTKRHAWTYDVLAEKADRIAQAILAEGGEPDERLALLFEHDAPMIAGILGALQSGRTYVPLDPTYPQERLAYILQDSQASAILTNDQNQALALSLKGSLPLINIDRIDSASLTRIQNPAVPPDAPAYILYTSGSTGKPKGVVQSHCNVLYHIRNYTNNLHIGAQDRLTLLSSYSFDAAVMDIFGALLNGATLCPFDAKKESLQSLCDCLEEQEITLYHSTPTLYRYFMCSLAAGKQFPRVRLVVLGGEEVVKNDVEMYKEHFGRGCIFVNGLGPTESTVTLQYLINHETEITRNTVPVGYPVEDTEVLLLNEAKHETAVLGEIAIKSAHVAMGYWQQPEVSKARFLPDPQGSEKRIYCTGDMGRLLPEGSIEFVGRKDFQVKIRGYRVELGEVETVLNQHPSVCHTVVMAHDGEPGEKRLVAYIVPAEAQALTAEEVRRFLRGKLPDYMIPCAFVFLEALPLTPNGKVDRRALPVPDIDGSEVKYVAPRNALEAQLVNLWESVLGVRPIGVTDDFFDLGGHSLLGVRLFTQIEKLFGKQLALATLFQAPTVEQLANVLHQDNWSPPWTSLVAIQPGGRKPPFYCIHEVDGNVLYYRDLAMHLGPDQPFFGLQAQGLDGKQPPIARFEDIAAHYVAEIRSFQPNGPYFLGGSSLGGMVAFEMAQQLYAQGQKVALLALFDTWSPGYLKLLNLPLPYLVSRHVEALSHLGLRERLVYVRDRAVKRLSLTKWVTQYINKTQWWTMHNACRVYSSQRWPMPPVLLNFYVRETLIYARENYVPRPYPGKVTFFLAGHQPPRYYHDPRLDRESLIAAGFTDSENVETVWQQVSAQGWGALAAGGLEIIQVPGKHADIVREPHVSVLAEKLRMCIESGS